MKNGFTYNISEIAIYFFASFFNSNFVIIFGFWSNIIIEYAVSSKYRFEFCVFYLFHIGSVGIDKLNEIIHSDFDSIIFSCRYLLGRNMSKNSFILMQSPQFKVRSLYFSLRLDTILFFPFYFYFFCKKHFQKSIIFWTTKIVQYLKLASTYYFWYFFVIHISIHI